MSANHEKKSNRIRVHHERKSDRVRVHLEKERWDETIKRAME